MDKADFAKRYDELISEPRMQKLYGASGYFNVGYWTADTGNLPVACDRLVDEMAAVIPRDARVIIDVGCGLGAGTRRLAEQFPRALVIAVNLSTWQLAGARRRGVKVPVAMDAARLALGSGTVDAVLAVESAHHFDTRAEFLAEARRVLRPGGVIAIADMLFKDVDAIGSWMVPEPNRISTTAEYAKLLGEAGFVDVAVRDISDVSWVPFCSAMLAAFEGHEDYVRAIQDSLAHYVLAFARSVDPMHGKTRQREKVLVGETRYTADSELRHPARFFASAREDLRYAAAVGWQLFRRNVQVRYRNSLLGYLWLLLPTIGATAVCVYVYALRIVVIAPLDIPYPVYVLAGMTLWQTFVDALNAPLQQLKAGQRFITRSRVPHEALMLAGVLETLLNCSIRLVVLAALLVAYEVPMGAGLLLVPLGIAALVLLGLALGVLVAPVGLLYADVSRAMGMATGFWFFLTPVIYRLPENGILRLNPVTPLLDTTRAWLTASTPATDGFVFVCVVAAILLSIAWLLQRLARPHVVAPLG